MNEPLLEVQNLEVVYRDAVVGLAGVSAEVPEGAITCVLGTNGAGKTTLVRSVTGLLALHKGTIREGDIRFEGESIRNLSSREMVRRGVCQVPEGRMIFPTLSVEENLLLGASGRRNMREIRSDLDQHYDLFPVLSDRRRQLAGWMSGGEQQMLAVARALMGRPRLLICDELSLGLAPKIVAVLFEQLEKVNDEGTTILLIEQNARLGLRYAEYGYILETGRVVLDGPADQLRKNEDVQEFYLGGSGGSEEAFNAIKHYKKRKRWVM